MIAVAALLFTGSRGGLLALLSEAVLLLTAILARTRGRRRAMLAGAAGLLLVAAAGFLLYFAPSELAAKLASVVHFTDAAVSGDRPWVAHDTLRIFAAHPFSGTGLGTFEVVYPQFQSFPSDKSWPYAHNDYVQLLAETGTLGGLLALASLLAFARRVWQEEKRRSSDTAPSWISIGAAIGCCGLLVHSLFDFNLHIPANAAWFALCAAIAISADRRRTYVQTD